MPQKRNFSRSDRIAQQIMRESADILRNSLKAHDLSLVTVVDVEVTRDASHAKLFYTFLGDPDKRPEIAEILTRAAGFVRSELSQRIKMFSLPTVRFVYDDSIEKGRVLSALIATAVSTHALDDDEEMAAHDDDSQHPTA